jgi:hypothetical protein
MSGCKHAGLVELVIQALGTWPHSSSRLIGHTPLAVARLRRVAQPQDRDLGSRICEPAFDQNGAHVTCIVAYSILMQWFQTSLSVLQTVILGCEGHVRQHFLLLIIIIIIIVLNLV